MKKFFSHLLLFISMSALPVFAQNAPTTPPQQSQPAQSEETPEALRQWEQENASREVQEDTRYGELWNKTLMLLVVVLLILFAGTWYLKKFGGMGIKIKDGDKTARIQLLEKRVISPKAVVYLLSIDGHKIALSETSSGIQVLGKLAQTPVEEKPLGRD